MDLGGFERYRRYAGGHVVEEIETHHVTGDSRRFLLVDDVLRTDHPRLSTGAHYRYQLGNHLGSACLELNDDAEVISYEEYHPYGTSAYRATNNAVEAPMKRYRYTGMERDEESGLNYHSARYYAPWLGRWVSADPFSLIDGGNLIGYALDNPIGRTDTSGLASTGEVTEFDSDKLIKEFDALPNVSGDWIEAHKKFNETVQANLLEEPTPTTAREKSVDADIETEAHDRAVVNIVNAAIDTASALVRSKGIEVSEHDLLKIALQMVVYPYRTGHGLTENLILRDVDHFLTGRIQAWRDYVPRIPLVDIAPLGKGATNDPGIILLGNYAAMVYDDIKRVSFRTHPKPDEKHAKSSMDQDSKPASAPGGRFWAYFGGDLLTTRDHPSESAAPWKLKISYDDVKAARSTWSVMKTALEISYEVAKQKAAQTLQELIDAIENMGDPTGTLRFIGERMHD
ncbi:protein of unknown function [Nitrospira japonica]|uniref:RHS repeat-associated core domain-containing protein n=1 Tax=Nitrospira japonica TaxID=1325564 RepID=A0A1W1I7G8_9BACT|nr:RHS repeat-associated core domain-containing protein [Nitrospira japonica]SLM48753.1 protein of unknown function [Nitrospira japonica]